MVTILEMAQNKEMLKSISLELILCFERKLDYCSINDVIQNAWMPFNASQENECYSHVKNDSRIDDVFKEKENMKMLV